MLSEQILFKINLLGVILLVPSGLFWYEYHIWISITAWTVSAFLLYYSIDNYLTYRKWKKSRKFQNIRNSDAM